MCKVWVRDTICTSSGTRGKETSGHHTSWLLLGIPFDMFVCSRVVVLPSGKFWTRCCWWLYGTVNVLRATELCASTGCDEAGGDSSVNKVLVTQAGGPEFDSWNPHKKSGTLASSWNPSAGETVGDQLICACHTSLRAWVGSLAPTWDARQGDTRTCNPTQVIRIPVVLDRVIRVPAILALER